MSVTNVFREDFPNHISDVCAVKFSSLGKMGKPKDDGEYTLLACVVKRDSDGNLEVVSLGTGSKCIGASLLPCNGDALHDSHAEVIARRAFVSYLIEQIIHAASGNGSILECTESGKYKVKPGFTFHFYSSHTPCGDASIFPKQEWSQDCFGGELVDTKEGLFLDEVNMGILKNLTNGKRSTLGSTGEPLSKKLKNDMQENTDSVTHQSLYHQEIDNPTVCLQNILENSSIISGVHTQSKEQHSQACIAEATDIHRTGAKCVSGELEDPKVAGANYHVTGVLRTKPGRGDPTLSLSCSDKIFKWTILGMQGALLMPFLEKPVYLESITIGHCPYSQEAMERAVFARFRDRVQVFNLPPGFNQVIPSIFQSSIAFPYSRSVVTSNCANPDRVKPSPNSLIWSLTDFHINRHEVSVNGYKLGTTKKNVGTMKSWVSICRQVLLQKVLLLLEKTGRSSEPYKGKSYAECKELSENYQMAWITLKNHILCNWTKKPIHTKEFKPDSCSNFSYKFFSK
ncbi:tRNA-specific adenosine deaminase 1-like [Palaemon carinicauda]|uniref:tRNA-specific adenosine deaminase 1-like n=1 Tax=Palaemon carinicauda TaxID=392227 RepID=UPI0035B5A5B5